VVCSSFRWGAAAATFIVAAGNAGVGCGSSSNGSGPSSDAGEDGTSEDSSSTDTGTTEDSGATDTGTVDTGSGPVDSGGQDGGDGGSPPITSVTAVANGGFSRPFDSAPDPTGTKIYFTAFDVNGNPGAFTVPAAGGSVAAVYTGGSFVSPFGIAVSGDGQTLFVADVGATSDPTNPVDDAGEIFALPSAGGTAPSSLVDNVRPCSLEVSGTTVYFTGTDKATGMPGVFTVSTSGGNVTTIAEGSPFVDPSGVTVDAHGNVFVVDTVGGAGGSAIVYKIPSGGTPTALVPQLQVGYPAGLTLSMDGASLYSSSYHSGSPANDQLLQIDTATAATTSNMTGAIATGYEPAGVHRAANASVYSWTDTGAGTTGTIYVLK
jgi:sugar lactone lactonase YvrE